MRKGRRSIVLMILPAGAIVVLLMGIGFLYGQVGAQQNKQTQQPQVYNPYPPGILPSDLPQEIKTVRGEISFIENKTISESHALGPLTYTGQPPIIQGTGYESMRILTTIKSPDQDI